MIYRGVRWATNKLANVKGYGASFVVRVWGSELPDRGRSSRGTRSVRNSPLASQLVVVTLTDGWRDDTLRLDASRKNSSIFAYQ